MKAVTEFLQGTNAKETTAQEKSPTDKKKEHDIQNCFTCLRILADDLEDGQFSEETLESIGEYGNKLAELTGGDEGKVIIEAAEMTPASLAKLVLSVRDKLAL